MRISTLTVLMVLLAWGCSESAHQRAIDDGGLDDGGTDADVDADIDADSDGDSDPWCPYSEFQQSGTSKVDLLFVVDNSRSMNEEQGVLARQIVVMANQLLHPEPGPDGLEPIAVEDLRIGIVSTDLGTGGHTIMTCEEPIHGDWGHLQNVGRIAGCQSEYTATGCSSGECPWLEHSPEWPDDGSDPENPPIWEDFACIATLGTDGCGFEQQMEAALTAVTTQAGPGNHNDGFVRDDSILAVVFVTDEDDCSTDDVELFDPARDDLGAMNMRCILNEERLHGVERYYNGLRSLRPGNEDLVMVAAITGVPIDGSWSPGDPVDALRELRRVNPSNPNELLPSCDTAMGFAYPPVRFAELVAMFGENGILQSICHSDWTAPLEAITRKIQSKIRGACLNQPLPTTDIDACRVVETLLDDRPCPHPMEGPAGGRTGGWHRDLGLDSEGLRRCEILPADYDADGCPDGPCDCESGDYEGCLEGWIYNRDDDLCEHGQVRFTAPSVTSDLSTVRIECIEGCEESDTW